MEPEGFSQIVVKDVHGLLVASNRISVHVWNFFGVYNDPIVDYFFVFFSLPYKGCHIVRLLGIFRNLEKLKNVYERWRTLNNLFLFDIFWWRREIL